MVKFRRLRRVLVNAALNLRDLEDKALLLNVCQPLHNEICFTIHIKLSFLLRTCQHSLSVTRTWRYQGQPAAQYGRERQHTESGISLEKGTAHYCMHALSKRLVTVFTRVFPCEMILKLFIHVLSYAMDRLVGLVVSKSDYWSPALPQILKMRIRSGTGCIQPREDNCVATWLRSIWSH